jgi:hypothetical protein
MENKTISYLNGKTWYRLLKVVFIIAFFIVLGCYNVFVFSDGIRQVDQKETIIKCNYSEKSFTAASVGASFNVSDFDNRQFDYESFYEGYNEVQIGFILTACYPNSDPSVDIYDDQKSAELIAKDGFLSNAYNEDWNAYEQETSGLFESEKTQYLDFSVRQFDVTPAFTYSRFLWLFFMGNFLTLLIFEAVRRAFYYIVLGSVKPKK